MTNPRIALYRQWQAEAAAHDINTNRGAHLGLYDAVWAECLALSAMIERGETTAEELMREAKELDGTV